MSWTNRVRNEDVLQGVKVERNIVHKIGQILRRDCLLRRVIEGKIREGQKWKEEEEDDVATYWKTLRKRENTGKWKKEH